MKDEKMESKRIQARPQGNKKLQNDTDHAGAAVMMTIVVAKSQIHPRAQRICKKTEQGSANGHDVIQWW